MRNLIQSVKFKTLIFPFLGFFALVWFLLRVIPKPGRASYPCMRAMAPLASSFVIYIIGLFASAYIFTKAKLYLKQSKYVLFGIALILSIIITFISLPVKQAKAADYCSVTPDGPNNPMGVGTGVMPGRVAWIYNPDATDKFCTNSSDAFGDIDYWWMNVNTKVNLVNLMFIDGIKMLTNTTDEKTAWDSIFCYYNRTHGRGNENYKAGEKIVIKINLNAPQEFSEVNTSPQVIWAIVRSLVKTVGVKAEDITYGDPWLSVGTVYDKIQRDFPGIKAIGNGKGYVRNATSSEKIYASDKKHSTFMPGSFVEASYLINVPVFKKHHRAGISLTSKNHFGTMAGAESSAANWHYSLPSSGGFGDVDNGKYGLYRCFVDFMGYKHLGGKTILYVIDGLWGSTNWAHPPIKWRMSPFLDDWPSSLFLSQDPVAIESVAFDFLFYEFDKDHPTEGGNDDGDNRGPFPHYPGTDDFLHQAADTNNWAEGITYAPNGDGVPMKSMGVHEHWNNAEEKKYSRNLGLKKGIELVSNYLTGIKSTSISESIVLKNSPNPFASTTSFQYQLQKSSKVSLFIYDIRGSLIRELVNNEQNSGFQNVTWDGLNNNGSKVASGIYLAKIMICTNNEMRYQIAKIVKK